jgi:hypothetical protein
MKKNKQKKLFKVKTLTINAISYSITPALP